MIPRLRPDLLAFQTPKAMLEQETEMGLRSVYNTAMPPSQKQAPTPFG
jgi:hypothetical protein